MKSKDKYKVRVVILRCQNLTAVDPSLNINARLAGFSALCSADPYPIL